MGANQPMNLKNADKFELKVVSTGETWVNIKNGKGHSFFQGMLKKVEQKVKQLICRKKPKL